MSHVVVNLMDVDDYVGSLNVDGRMRSWFTRSLKKELISRRDWLTRVSIVTSDNEHVKRAIRNNESVFKISFSNDMNDEIRHVVDWISELEQRDPRLFVKLDRISWKQSVEHSRRWHEALARKAEKLKSETIPFDENCPVVLECDDGLKWVWLKTDKARDDEGRIMGHCVGSGWYDDLDCYSGVFSLRDAEGRPHVTVEMNKVDIIQSKMNGNVDVSDKYCKYVNEFHRFMSLKLTAMPKAEGFDHIVRWNGDEEWYFNRRLHREDGPAIVKKNGTKEWWLRGRHHREDGPSVIYFDGTNIWYFNGLIHRLGGPAIENSDGSREWLVNGVKHRNDGPAVERSHGVQEWWVDGKRHREDGPAIKYHDGSVFWYQHDKLHREDGPAVEYEDGSKYWYRHGLRHRVDGPANSRFNGEKEWWVNDKLHREDGPAIERVNGDKEWWVNGLRHRENGPAIDKIDGTQEWWCHGQRHRIDGPAVVRTVSLRNSAREWWVDGKRHRIDGPAVEYFDEKRSWWIDGVSVSEFYFECEANLFS